MKQIGKFVWSFVVCALLLGQWSIPAQAQSAAQPSAEIGLFRALMDKAADDATPFVAKGSSFTAAHNGLDAELDAGFFSVHALDAAWKWNVRLSGIGKGSSVDAVGQAETNQREDGSISMNYASVVEWHRNTSLGFQQGFDIPRAPRGSGALELRLALETNMPATLSADERSLSFDAGEGATLHYANLHAYDANGAALSARILLGAGEIVLQVEDAGAAYPVTVDPVTYYETELAPFNPVQLDAFGWSVDINGNTAVVGVPGYSNAQGKAYVFERIAGIWTYKQDLVAVFDGSAGDFFGMSVAVSGTTIVVGAPRNTVGANAQQGSVYVFTKQSNGDWTMLLGSLSASDGSAGDEFGSSVDIQGNTIIVGSPYRSFGANTNQGSVYVFGYVSGTWVEQQILTFPVLLTITGAQLGTSVAISNGRIVAGAPQYKDVTTGVATGIALVYVYAAGAWNYEAGLTGSDSQSSDQFGASVAIDGTTIVAGAPWHDGSGSNMGGAYVFFFNGSAWGEQAKLADPKGATNDYFGQAVAVKGDDVFVGTKSMYDGGAGKVFKFTRSAGVWTQSLVLQASDPQPASGFGQAIAASTGEIIVGARGFSRSGASNSGAAYIYDTPQSTNFDFGVNVTASDKTVSFGSWVTLTTRVRNYGPNQGSATVSVPLPKGFNLYSYSATRGTYDSVTGIWSSVTLPNGTSATLTLVGTVDLSVNNTIQKFGASMPNGTDKNNANNLASVSIAVGNPQALLNSSFEKDAIAPLKVPDYWTKNGAWSASDGRTTAYKVSGVASVLLKGDGSFKTLSQIFAFTGVAGDKFTLSLWSKSVSVPVGSIYRVTLKFYNGNTLITTRTVSFSTGTHDFQKKAIVYTTTSNYSRVVTTIEFKAGLGQAWFDAASLVFTPAP